MTSYILVAVAFQAAIAAAPTPPAITHIGEFDSALACQNAAVLLAQDVSAGPLQSFNRGPHVAAAILRCLPTSIPAFCAAEPTACPGIAIPPVIAFQPAP